MTDDKKNIIKTIKDIVEDDEDNEYGEDFYEYVMVSQLFGIGGVKKFEYPFYRKNNTNIYFIVDNDGKYDKINIYHLNLNYHTIV